MSCRMRGSLGNLSKAPTIASSTSLSLIATKDSITERERVAAAVAVARAATRGGGLRRLFSTSNNFSPLSGGDGAEAPRRQQNEPSTSLFVSGLNKRTTSERLREAFSKFGEVVHARVVTDRVTGYSRGFGFVRYSTLEDAANGITGMDAQFLDGWVIFAEYAKPREPPTSSPEPSGSYPAYSSTNNNGA